MTARICKNCRYWDVHSSDMRLGDCRAPSDHRYWRHELAGGGFALLDSFERAETKPDDHCGAWSQSDDRP